MWMMHLRKPPLNIRTLSVIHFSGYSFGQSIDGFFHGFCRIFSFIVLFGFMGGHTLVGQWPLGTVFSRSVSGSSTVKCKKCCYVFGIFAGMALQFALENASGRVETQNSLDGAGDLEGKSKKRKNKKKDKKKLLLFSHWHGCPRALETISFWH